MSPAGCGTQEHSRELALPHPADGVGSLCWLRGWSHRSQPIFITTPFISETSLSAESSCNRAVVLTHTPAGAPAGRMAPEGCGDVLMAFRLRKSFRGPCFHQMQSWSAAAHTPEPGAGTLCEPQHTRCEKGWSPSRGASSPAVPVQRPLL